MQRLLNLDNERKKKYYQHIDENFKREKMAKSMVTSIIYYSKRLNNYTYQRDYTKSESTMMQ